MLTARAGGSRLKRCIKKQVIDFEPTERRPSSPPGAAEAAVDTEAREFGKVLEE